MNTSSYKRHCSKSKILRNKKKLINILIVFTFLSANLALLPAKPALTQVKLAQTLSLEKNVLYVNPKNGDDSQTGEPAEPLKTITQALKIAKAGTTIKLSSGTYSQDTGETFPLIIKDRITLQGNAKIQGYETIIKGSGNFSSPTGAGQNVAIAALKDAGGVTGVTVTNEHSRGHGLWIESSDPKIVSNSFVRNGNTGVSVNGNSSPLIEDNYFYNNSGNGLLIYGTSKPEVIGNTFEQTGFGVSVIQNAAPTLIGNKFDSNRIGIILEGNSQGKLRDNEIINSGETGLTAIAKSRVDLGTDNEPGNNIFRSNKKLDIQNATSNEIVAVGTEINGDIEGNVNLDRGEFVAEANSDRLPPLPLNNNQPPAQLSPPPVTPTSSLPSPPPLSEPQTNNKEYVFTAPSTASKAPEPEPVPSLPPVNDSSQISSLSDVLGSNAAIKYKVLVEAEDESTQLEVRSLYPQAFATVYQGKSVLQVGAFNNWDKAKQTQRSLEDIGLDTHILE